MPISHSDLEIKDVDWFAIDRDGHVGHFTSGGCGPVPKVLVGTSDLDELFLYFGKQAGKTSLALESANWDKRVRLTSTRPNARGFYLHDYLEMATKGIYSYDVDHRARPITYFRVAIPQTPILFTDLPSQIKSILSNLVIRDICFGETCEISTKEIVDCF